MRHMQWWNDVVDWFLSAEGRQVLLTAVLPFVAILLAGVLAALIARSAVKRLIASHDRETASAAVAALIGAGRRTAVWSSLSGAEKDRIDALATESEIRVRLLPVHGSKLAADWAAHQLLELRSNSSNFSFQSEQTLLEYRDRLLAWSERPKRAKKLFALDLEAWKYEDTTERDLAAKQQSWIEQQERSTSQETATPRPAAASPAAHPAPSTPAPASAPAPAPASDDAQTKAYERPRAEEAPSPARDTAPATGPVSDDAPTTEAPRIPATAPATARTDTATALASAPAPTTTPVTTTAPPETDRA